MDTKKLAKIIKVIVEKEINAKLPALIQEGVKAELKKMGLEQNPSATKIVAEEKWMDEEVDMFALADSVIEEDRKQSVAPKKQFTKNSAINEILNQTTPFSAAQRAGVVSQPSVLDKLPQINEVSANGGEMEEWPMMGGSPVTSKNAQAGMGMTRAEIAAKMGYGDMANPSGGNAGGLGVQTGLSGLDRILNRDNSELVKKFRTRK